MEERYARNIPAISEDEQNILNAKTVIVIGCGGLGGYAIEYLARLGVGKIIAVDGDVFSESNMNRQLLCTTDSLGKSKAEIAVARINAINPAIEAVSICEYLTAESAAELVAGVDLVIDSLDNVESRLILEDVCENAGVTFIHGAVQGWTLQASVVTPGSRVLHSLYRASDSNSKKTDSASADVAGVTGNTEEHSSVKTCLCPTPACCASIQVAEAIKNLLGRESSLTGQVLFMDLQTMESYTI